MSTPPAEATLSRVIAMIPWIAARPRASKDDIADRFRVSRAELDRDLALIMMIGVPPYSPGDYITVIDDGDTVELLFADHFKRPLQLSQSEGLALLASSRALLAVEGSDQVGSLATAVEKLERALGATAVAIEFGTPEHLRVIRSAATAGESIEVDYWSAGRDATTTRLIDPGPAFFALGKWYTDAYCHLRGEDRMFRVDRVRAVRPSGKYFEPDKCGAREPIFSPRPTDPRVTIETLTDVSWVTEAAAVESITELPGGRQQLVIAFGERAWLERLLVRLGATARVVNPPELHDLGPGAARRVLARYNS